MKRQKPVFHEADAAAGYNPLDINVMSNRVMEYRANFRYNRWLTTNRAEFEAEQREDARVAAAQQQQQQLQQQQQQHHQENAEPDQEPPRHRAPREALSTEDHPDLIINFMGVLVVFFHIINGT